MGLVFALVVAPWLEGGRWRCALRFFAFFLSNARFPVLPIPQLPLGSVFPETSQKLSKKAEAPPPPPSHNMRKRLGSKRCARARKSGMCTRARSPRWAGWFSHNEGNRFFSPPPTSRRCASALGQPPWPLREGRAGPERSNSCTARLRTGSSSPRRLFHAACGSVFDKKFL